MSKRILVTVEIELPMLPNYVRLARSKKSGDDPLPMLDVGEMDDKETALFIAAWGDAFKDHVAIRRANITEATKKL